MSQKVYLANGLFSIADFRLNEYLAEEIRKAIPNVDLFVPQEQGINDKEGYADSEVIFHLDMENVVTSDVVVAVIDGVEIDSGVACEIGIAVANHIPVIALYSDIRQQGTGNDKKVTALLEDATENQFMYRNLFVVGAIKANGTVVNTVDNLIAEIVHRIK